MRRESSTHPLIVVAYTATCLFLLSTCSEAGPAPEPPRLDRLETSLAPAGPLLQSDTARAHLLGYDQFHNPHPIGAVTWHSNDSSIAAITGDGLVRGRSQGSTSIVGSADGLSASLALVVAGTLHREAIRASEVWAATGAPHVVEGRLPVGGPGGVTLTFEPGVTVLFRPNSGLDFGLGGAGTLVANGTSAPIVLRGMTDVGSHWDGLTFRGPGQAEVRHTTLRDCGGTFGMPLACVTLRDSGGGPAPTILIDEVLIRGGDGSGVALEGQARFAAGSQGLSVENMLGVVATVPVSAAAGFPLGGSIGGNGTNEIWLRDTLHTSGDMLAVSTTWGNPGVPWHLYKTVFIEGPQAPILTIAAGSTLIFEYATGFVVGKGAPGGLQIGGAAGAWVVLKSEAQYSWGGLQFWSQALPSSVTRTELRRCGSGNGGCVFMTTDVGQGAPAPVLDSVTILSPDGLGVVALRYGRFGAGSRALRITGGSGYPMMLWTGAAATIPSGSFTGNAQDVILITAEDVLDSMTWSNPGVPFGIVHLLVAHQNNPVLTLQPGVVLKFNQYGDLQVGVGSPGGLRALGTDQAPVTFTSYSPVAYPGFWNGLVIGPMADASTLLDHVTVDDAGAFDGVSQAAIKIARDYGEIIRNSLIRRSGDCGIARQGVEPWTTDFTALQLGNTFQDNTGPSQCGP